MMNFVKEVEQEENNLSGAYLSGKLFFLVRKQVLGIYLTNYKIDYWYTIRIPKDIHSDILLYYLMYYTQVYNTYEYISLVYNYLEYNTKYYILSM